MFLWWKPFICGKLNKRYFQRFADFAFHLADVPSPGLPDHESLSSACYIDLLKHSMINIVDQCTEKEELTRHQNELEWSFRVCALLIGSKLCCP